MTKSASEGIHKGIMKVRSAKGSSWNKARYTNKPRLRMKPTWDPDGNPNRLQNPKEWMQSVLPDYQTK